MKIAFLSFYSGIYERGVETLVKQLGEHLSQSCDLTIYQGGDTGRSSFKTKIYKVPWSSTLQEPMTLKKRLLLDSSSIAVGKFTLKILRDLRKEKFDVIIPWNNGWQTILCRLFGFGKVVTVGQAGIGWDDRINLWSFPSYFVGFTDYQCKWAKSVNPLIKIEKISNGVDINRFKSSGERYKLDLPKPIILSVAALVKMKRHDLAIRAVSKMEKGSLVVVGRGEEKENLIELGNKLLPGRFTLLSLPFNDIPKIYRSADLLTFPTSNWESFGLVLLEAMASGLPVATTDDPIRREIVGDAGLFVDPTDTDKYAQTLEKALDTKWENLPRKQAEKFDWGDIAKKYEKIFLKLT